MFGLLITTDSSFSIRIKQTFSTVSWQIYCTERLQPRQGLEGNGLTVLSLLEVMMMRRSWSILA